MKKILEITKEVEQHLVSLMDVALKSVGMGAMTAINKISSMIQSVPVSEEPSAPELDAQSAPAPVAPDAPSESVPPSDSAGQ